mgnify:CR=1 FL=1
MANSKIIVVEGPQGAGKTTITDFLRHTLPYSNLYRMSGTADTADTAVCAWKKLRKTVKPLCFSGIFTI